MDVFRDVVLQAAARLEVVLLAGPREVILSVKVVPVVSAAAPEESRNSGLDLLNTSMVFTDAPFFYYCTP